MSGERFIARQPVFDGRLEVHGYELLHRSGWSNVFDSEDAERASIELIDTSLLVNSLQELTGNKLGFVNIPEHLLVQDVVEILPATQTVIEVLETVDPTPDVLAALKRLRRSGFLIALDDFVDDSDCDEIVQLADIIKIDCRSSSLGEQSAVIARHRRPGLRFLAEKIETYEEFARARDMGFSLFQGHFFCRPELIKSRGLPKHKLSYLAFLREIGQQELVLERVEATIKQEISLTARLLRYVNSVNIGLVNQIESIRQALVHLGEMPLRRLGSLIALIGLGDEKPLELAKVSLARAAFCEKLASEPAIGEAALDLYLSGLFSSIDALLDQPLREALKQVGLKKTVEQAILGDASALSLSIQLAVACERGDWDHLAQLSGKLRVPEARTVELHLASTRWAESVFAPALLAAQPA